MLAASRHDALIVASRLERAGHPVALQPDAWAGAAAGGRVVVGTRSAVLAPVAGLGAIVVLDAHADSYQEERVPTWEATVLAEERARRAGAPCLLVSACPGVDLVTGRPLITLSRESERAGWAPMEVLDARDEDPRAGGYPARLAAVIRQAADADRERPVVVVLNRKGRARLLACRRCRSLLRCEVCGGALVQLERQAAGQPAVLHCPRCSLDVPARCAECGPTRPVIVRPGVARARDDLAALTGLEVAEIGARGRRPTPWRRPRSSSGPRPCCTAPARHLWSCSSTSTTSCSRPATGPASRLWRCWRSPPASSAADAAPAASWRGHARPITRSWTPPCTPIPVASSPSSSPAGPSSASPPRPRSPS